MTGGSGAVAAGAGAAERGMAPPRGAVSARGAAASDGAGGTTGVTGATGTVPGAGATGTNPAGGAGGGAVLPELRSVVRAQANPRKETRKNTASPTTGTR